MRSRLSGNERGRNGRLSLLVYTGFDIERAMAARKPVVFLGSSLADLRGFPEAVRRQAGVQLYLVQLGLDPADWEPLPTVGPGVREIRIRDGSGAFRVLYVTKMADAIYVLHAFQKKSQKTSASDLDLALSRLKQI